MATSISLRRGTVFDRAVLDASTLAENSSKPMNLAVSESALILIHNATDANLTCNLMGSIVPDGEWDAVNETWVSRDAETDLWVKVPVDDDVDWTLLAGEDKIITVTAPWPFLRTEVSPDTTPNTAKVTVQWSTKSDIQKVIT